MDGFGLRWKAGGREVMHEFCTNVLQQQQQQPILDKQVQNYPALQTWLIFQPTTTTTTELCKINLQVYSPITYYTTKKNKCKMAESRTRAKQFWGKSTEKNGNEIVPILYHLNVIYAS